MGSGQEQINEVLKFMRFMAINEHQKKLMLPKIISNSELIIYPDSGHGAIFQFNADFVSSNTFSIIQRINLERIKILFKKIIPGRACD